MRAAGESEEAIRSFRSAYERLAGGESAVIPQRRARARGRRSGARRAARRSTRRRRSTDVALIKLNGGLATTMGLQAPEVAARGPRRAVRSWTSSSARRWRCARATASRLPLVLMNSEATRGGDARGARRAPRARGRRPRAGLPPEHDPQARRRDARAGELAGGAGARVVPARPRRRLRRAAALGDARGAARARLRATR